MPRYTIPEPFLTESSIDYKLRLTELGRHQRLGQVVAGAKGSKLAAYVVNDSWPDLDDDWHPRVSFTGGELARVQTQIIEPVGGQVVIDSAALQREEGGADVTLTGGVIHTMPFMERQTLQLPEQVNNWQPALNGLYQRLTCQLACKNSHYGELPF